jgi:hypothetical protein
MPLGAWTITADPQCAALRDGLAAYLRLTTTAEAADVVVSRGVPTRQGTHVLLTGPLTDEVEAWDADIPPQTVAGALWLPPDQPEAEWAAIAWLLLRLQSPATPLSDLTDGNERALRWSVVAATGLGFPEPQPAAVDPAEITARVDALPAVQDLGQAVQRLGGDTAEAVLTATERFRSALAALDVGPAADLTAFDAAVAQHLGQVQRSGFSRWRSGKTRAASAQALSAAGREAAGRQLELLLARCEQESADAAALDAAAHRGEVLEAALRAALEGLSLPAEPDFTKVPRSWAQSAPQPRHYVFVAEGSAEDLPEVAATVRECPQVPAGTAVVALVQSGFSLPAVR